MLVYNSKKEFIGIDEKALKVFGYKDLESLRAEVSDIADLFVKTPGYVHNFKHVHWIDFITCADSNEEIKVIINIKHQNYKARVSIAPLFLADDPSTQAYAVYLNNLRELDVRENEEILGDIVPHIVPQDDSLKVVEKLDTPEKPDVEVAKQIPVVLDEMRPKERDKSLDINDTEQESQKSEEYIYDPHLASIELGLPLDLIEEFVQDFIVQAQEFKKDIYTALDQREYAQVKTLSHKLKGVAANLRIEDAFNALSVVNTADNSNIIQKHLNLFYEIIDKLAGEKMVEDEVLSFKEESPQTPKQVIKSQNTPAEEDDGLYKNLLDIQDFEVPQKIVLPELADDDYLATDLNLDAIEDEIDKIQESDVLDIGQKREFTDEDILLLQSEDEPEIVLNYSKEKSAKAIGIDLKSFNELFEDYIQESGTIISEIKRALENDDLVACQHEAIRLKGISQSMKIDCFTQELEVLIESLDIQEMFKALERIEMFIIKISKTET